MREKENARRDFVEMIKESWTFARLTETEKTDCIRLLTEENGNAVKGSYLQRWEILNAVYYGFLAALGYMSRPWAWREEKPESIPFSQP